MSNNIDDQQPLNVDQDQADPNVQAPQLSLEQQVAAQQATILLLQQQRAIDQATIAANNSNIPKGFKPVAPTKYNGNMSETSPHYVNVQSFITAVDLYLDLFGDNWSDVQKIKVFRSLTEHDAQVWCDRQTKDYPNLSYQQFVEAFQVAFTRATDDPVSLLQRLTRLRPKQHYTNYQDAILEYNTEFRAISSLMTDSPYLINAQYIVSLSPLLLTLIKQQFGDDRYIQHQTLNSIMKVAQECAIQAQSEWNTSRYKPSYNKKHQRSDNDAQVHLIETKRTYNEWNDIAKILSNNKRCYHCKQPCDRSNPTDFAKHKKPDAKRNKKEWHCPEVRVETVAELQSKFPDLKY